MFRFAAPVLVWTLALAAVMPSLAKEPPAPVRILGAEAAPTFALVPDLKARSAMASLPVERADDFEGTLEVTRALHDKRLVADGAFTVEFEPERKDRLKITAPLDKLPQPVRDGTYALTLEALENKKKWAPVTLTLSYPKSVLLPAPSVLVDCRSFWKPCGPEELPALRLRTKEGPLPLDAEVQLVEGPRQGDVNVSGQVIVGGFERVLAGVMAAPLESVAKFPVGSSTGKLGVRAPGLTSLDVALTVKQRRPSVLLILAAFVGIVAGFVIRVLLQRWVDNGLAKAEVGRIEARLQEERSRSKDTKLQSEIDKLLERLTTALGGLLQRRDATRKAQAKAELQTIQSDLESALTASEGRKVAMRQEAEALSALLEGRWTLPKAGEDARETGLARLGQIQVQIEQGAIEKARTDMDTHREQTIASLAAAWKDFQNGCKKLRGIRQSDPPLPEKVAQSLNAGSAKLDEWLGKALPPTGADDATLRKALELLHGGHHVLHAVLESTATGVQATVERCAALYRSAEGDQAATRWEPANEAAEALHRDGRIEDVADDPGERLEAWSGALQGSLAKLRQCITGSVKGALPGSVETALNAGRYVSAAKEAAAPLRAGGVALGGRQEPQVSEEVEAAPPSEPRFVRERAVPILRPTIPVANWILVDVPQAWKQVAIGKALQTTISTVGLLGLAYVVFEPGWIGTTRDFASVIAWGFALDVSVGTLASEAASRLKPATS